MRERTEYHFICAKRDSKRLSDWFIQFYLTDCNNSKLLLFPTCLLTYLKTSESLMVF